METLLMGAGAFALLAFVSWLTGLKELELRLKFGRNDKPPEKDPTIVRPLFRR